MHLTVSPSPVHFTFAFSVFARTSHESPCVMSSLIPPPLHAHIPYCIPLLSGLGSDSIFRVRAPGSDSSQALAPTLLPLLRPGSIFRVRAPCPDSFSQAPALNVLPLSSPGSIFRVQAPGSDSFSQAPAPNVLPLSSPGSHCPQTHAPFPPSPHFFILPLIEYSSLQFHFDIQQNNISSNVIIMC